MNAAVRIIPWTRPFFENAAAYLAARFPEGFEHVLTVFPHRRAGRYLTEAFSRMEDLQKPMLLPRIVPVEEWLSSLGERLFERPPRLLGPLDRAGLLFEIIRDLRGAVGGRAAEFPDDLAAFFPWGMRLAALCEELFRQNVPAADVLYARDQVLPQAAAILENLGAIHAAYRERLLADGAATPGLCQAVAAENVQEAVRLASNLSIVSCGAYVMSGAEETVCRELFRQGSLEFLWHADPMLAGRPEKAHFACREQRDWLADWNIRAEMAPGFEDAAHDGPGAGGAPPPCLPVMRFYEGYDLHSQLTALVEELCAADSLENSAIVLPDTGMLMPVLHHLPHKDVNISMGYPLARSSLAQLVETLLALQESRLDEKRYYWRDVLALFRHPYLKMLRLGEAEPLRALFHGWEALVRGGGKYLDPFALPMSLPDADTGEPAADPEALAVLVARLTDACFAGFARARSLRGLGEALAGLCDLLLTEEYCGDVWERYLIDAECLFRLADAVIPALSGAAVGAEILPRSALFAALRGLLTAERVAFEAEPIAGLQVLGMLETRLMTFKTVYVLDAVDASLPGAEPYDPLLPDALRSLLGLPDGRRRDLVAAYNFYRLLMGARDAVVLYQCGVQTGGAFEDKAVRSRFVEQLLWELEKRRGAIIKPGEEPLRAISLPLTPLPRADDAVEKTPAIRDRLLAHLAKRPLSASALDAYLRCPKSFFLRYLTPLRPLEEVAEDGDPAAFGDMMHAVLQAYFTPYAGKTIEGPDLPEKPLTGLYLERLAEQPFYQQSPPDLRIILERAGCERLRRFLANTPRTAPLAFEVVMDAEITVAGTHFALRGTADRIDRRENGEIILDYKTGTVKKTAPGFFADEPLFDRMRSWTPGRDPDLLEDLASGLGSAQLPFYLHLRARSRAVADYQGNAAFVELKDAGRELPLFGDKDAEEDRIAALDAIPDVLAFIIRHLTESPRFEAAPSKICQFCEYRPVCGEKG